MNLRMRLNKTSRCAGKFTYAELIKELESTARDGKYDMYIDYDVVLWEDIDELKKAGLAIEHLNGEEYSDNGCWHISWET